MATTPDEGDGSVRVPSNIATDLLMQRRGTDFVPIVQYMDEDEVTDLIDTIDGRIGELMEDPERNERQIKEMAFKSLILNDVMERPEFYFGEVETAQPEQEPEDTEGEPEEGSDEETDTGDLEG